MNLKRASPCLAVLFVATFVVFSLFFSLVESRPRRFSVSASLQDSFPRLIVPSQYSDYDYPDFQIPQGPRRRRWAFPVDVQDGLCPPGQKRHSSGYGCVSDEDDY